MKKILLAAAFLVAAPAMADTRVCRHGHGEFLPTVEVKVGNNEAPKKKNYFRAAAKLLASTTAGTMLGGLIERMFRNQVNYGLKYGALFGGLIGARFAAEDLWGKQDPWLWHDIIHLAARLAERDR